MQDVARELKNGHHVVDIPMQSGLPVRVNGREEPRPYIEVAIATKTKEEEDALNRQEGLRKHVLENQNIRSNKLRKQVGGGNIIRTYEVIEPKVFRILAMQHNTEDIQKIGRLMTSM